MASAALIPVDNLQRSAVKAKRLAKPRPSAASDASSISALSRQAENLEPYQKNELSSSSTGYVNGSNNGHSNGSSAPHEREAGYPNRSLDRLSNGSSAGYTTGMAANWRQLAARSYEEEAFERLSRDMRSNAFIVKYKAIKSVLPEAQVNQMLPVLMEVATNDPSPLLQSAALKVMAHGIPSQLLPYAGQLEDLLRSEEQLVRRHALEMLVKIGPEALRGRIEILAKLAEDDFWPVRWWVICGLAALGDDATGFGKVLINLAVTDTEKAVRDEAARAIGEIARGSTLHIRTMVNHMMGCSSEFAQDMYVHAMSLVLDTTDEKHRRDMVAAMDDLLYSAEGAIRMKVNSLLDELEEDEQGKKIDWQREAQLKGVMDEALRRTHVAGISLESSDATERHRAIETLLGVRIWRGLPMLS
mmetsp:Transcript_56260/g.131796  ORF Transcript_56260/g.131796 Transcript_56260/m.131796 type:complete len:416 (+) Transcript_56260:65-1312(+)